MPFESSGKPPTGTLRIHTFSIADTIRRPLSALMTAKPDRQYVEFQVTTANGLLLLSDSDSDITPQREVHQAIGDGSWLIPLGPDANVYLLANSSVSPINVVVTEF